MTFNVHWLLASSDEAQRLTTKGISGLSHKMTEEGIQAQHDELAQVIATKEPDVVCLQEVINEAALSRLVRTLQMNEAYYEPHFVNSRSTFLEQDVVFLTKRSPDKTSDERIYRPSAPAKAAVLELEFAGERYAFVGIHLLARPDDSSRRAAREQQANDLVQVLKDLRGAGRTSIVLGDFNDWDRQTPDTDLQANPISEVFEIIKNYDSSTPEQELFNAAAYIDDLEDRYTHIYRGSRTMLDHILLPNTLRMQVQAVAIEHRVNARASDHRPVIVDLKTM